MSAPAQNPRPAPVTTTTRTSGSVAALSRDVKYPSCRSGLHAFKRSGRFSVMIATRSRTSYSTASFIARRYRTQIPDGGVDVVSAERFVRLGPVAHCTGFGRRVPPARSGV